VSSALADTAAVPTEADSPVVLQKSFMVIADGPFFRFRTRVSLICDSRLPCLSHYRIISVSQLYSNSHVRE